MAYISPLQSGNAVLGPDGKTISKPWFKWFQELLNVVKVSAVYLADTHANRLAKFPVTSYIAPTLFYELDRRVAYAVSPDGQSWLYSYGIQTGTAANMPVDLGVNDAGYMYFQTDTGNTKSWSGTVWKP